MKLAIHFKMLVIFLLAIVGVLQEEDFISTFSLL